MIRQSTRMSTEEAADSRSEGRELESVTDRVAELELDASRTEKALCSLDGSAEEEKQRTRRREEELRSVKVEKADVEFLVKEFEVDKAKADRVVRECGGDLLEAAKALLRA